MSEDKKERKGVNHLLRICAGGYLLYLAWSLIGEVFAGTATSLWVGVGASTLFAVVGGALLVTSGRAMYRQKKEEAEQEES